VNCYVFDATNYFIIVPSDWITEYPTEIDGYSKIVSYGQQGSGPAWRQVQTKSGEIMEFGNTGDSRIEAQGKSTVRLWAVNRIADTVGNGIDFGMDQA